jgi:glycerophosphoryl diester phosphodiesterase
MSISLKKISKLIILFIITMAVSSYACSPKIVAHRGGSKSLPENSINAFDNALKLGADLIEVDVQLTKDDEVVLYHPRDLSVLTEAKGSISEVNLNELKNLDAAYNFDPKGDKSFPERGKGYKIATLAEILDEFPNQEIIVDLKSLPANKLIESIIKLVDKKKAWDRLIFYSTNDDHLKYLMKNKPEARLFENRAQTRERLLVFRNQNTCCCQKNDSRYIGFELDREMLVEESFALGKSSNKIHFRLWDKDVIECIKASTTEDIKIFLFGINSKQDYEEAKRLNVYAVFTDKIETIK